MFEKIRKILADIEDSQNEIEMLLKLANLSLGDFIEIKRGSMDMPKGVNEAFFYAIKRRSGAIEGAY